MAAAPVSAQSGPDALDALASWIALDAATGYETRAAPELAEALGDGWSADRWGNVVRVVGSGTPRRIFACGLDRPSYAISQIRDDGYLRVHRIGRGSRHPLWDQQFEAQQVRILTRTGPVAGVVARANGHFAAQHRGDTQVVGADDLWIDVGAETAEDVAALGIDLLDPVHRHLPPWPLENAVAGPDASRRVGCAAVATLGAAGPASGQTHFVLSANEGMGWVGLSSYVARAGAFDQVVLAVAADEETTRVRETSAASSSGRMAAVLERAGVTEVTELAPSTRQAGSHMEVVGRDEAEDLLSAAVASLGMTGVRVPDWVAAPDRPPLRAAHAAPEVAGAADMLEALVELHGVSGHEWAVRRYVLEALPEWARERAYVDDIGDVVVEAGPDRDTTVFMAHTDEVGYVVDAIAPDGVVTLGRRGGAVSSAWEGQTALLHFDPPGAPSTTTGSGQDVSPRWKEQSLSATATAPLRGVFLTRSDPERKDPRTVRAWFGLDADGLAARGVVPGMQVTSHKEGLRLGRYRFVARALDDRAGTAALLLAIRDVDPDALTSKVIFTWSVHEEGGLLGAAAMARRFGASTTRVYSVDTFVSSDTPLESPHFAYAPLGAGPVLRAVENSGVSPDRERDRVVGAARDAGIPLQIGLTQGGTDGTQFTFWGAPNQGLSWPGRYSHSPGEVLDLRDLSNLVRLIGAVATTER